VVRETLGVSVGDIVAYEIKGGVVTLLKVSGEEQEHHDPAIESFLKLLTNDVELGKIEAVSENWLSYVRGLVQDVKFDRKEVLEGPVNLG
jgi:hypothetical protein